MSKLVKPISHFQRRYNVDMRPKLKVVQPVIDKRIVVYDEYDDNSCRVVRKSEFRTIDRKKEMENYKCSDFSLENMLTAGVDMKLTHLSSAGFSMLDNIENQLDKFSNSSSVKQLNNE